MKSCIGIIDYHECITETAWGIGKNMHVLLTGPVGIGGWWRYGGK